jgi:hypothetical protein
VGKPTNKNARILVISDMHHPYSHPDTTAFLAAIKKEYEPTRVICIGDEVDHHAMSFHDSDPDLYSAGDELKASIKALKPLYTLFPVMDLVDSNHGSMAYRKGKHHGVGTCRASTCVSMGTCWTQLPRAGSGSMTCSCASPRARTVTSRYGNDFDMPFRGNTVTLLQEAADALDSIDLVDGKVVGPDTAYKRLISMLDVESIRKAGFTSIVIDGLTELEQLVRSTTQWLTDCRSKTGEHNGFAEPAATVKAIRPVLDALRLLQRELDINYMVTCLLMVKGTEENGEITASEPKLLGYEVAAQLIPQFPDQIMVGRMTNAEGVVKPRLQFTSAAQKSVKEKNGTIKKLVGFTPRLRGVTELPATMPADLKAVLKLKGAK